MAVNPSSGLYGTCLMLNCVGKESPFDGITLFKIPDNEEALRKWKQNLGLPLDTVIPKSSRVCSRHFKPSDVQGKRLKIGAFPKLDYANDEDDEYELTEENDPSTNGKHYRKCCITNCFSGVDVRHFSFPQEEHQRKNWIEACHLTPKDAKKKIIFICEKHFSEQSLGRKRLRKDAFPDKNIPYEEARNQDFEHIDVCSSTGSQRILQPVKRTYAGPDVVEKYLTLDDFGESSILEEKRRRCGDRKPEPHEESPSFQCVNVEVSPVECQCGHACAEKEKSYRTIIINKDRKINELEQELKAVKAELLQTKLSNA